MIYVYKSTEMVEKYVRSHAASSYMYSKDKSCPQVCKSRFQLDKRS